MVIFLVLVVFSIELCKNLVLLGTGYVQYAILLGHKAVFPTLN